MSGRAWLLSILPAVLGLSACGFTGNLRGDPGFASFRAPSTMRAANRQFALSLGPVPMRLATMISRPVLGREEPWIPETLKAIRGVRVYIYEIQGGAERVHAHLERTRHELMADGWESIVAVREDGGLVSALVMPREPEKIRGLVVMVQDSEELVLVNVIGNIQPETFSTIMEGLDIEMPMIDIAEI